MTTSIDEALLEEISATTPSQAYKKIQQTLSAADMASYGALDKIFYPSIARRGGEAHKARIMSAFQSPLYSDSSKECFAAAHLNQDFILLSAGEFLTEKIILSYLKHPWPQILDLGYFAALMGSEHLSERIVLVAGRKVDFFEDHEALKLIPNTMIISTVIASWLNHVAWGLVDGGSSSIAAKNPHSFAAGRVKRAHPEYEGLPDEWVLRVFCGE